MKPTRPVALALAAATLLALPGCIEFQRQTMTFHHDEKSDTLFIYQRYEGIFGTDGGEGLSETEQSQLASVLTGERTFFFDNWIFEIDVDRMRSDAAKAASTLPGEPGEIASHALQMIAENTRVSTGPFHLAEGDRLCGVQRITIRNVSRVIAAVNEGARAQMRAESQKEGASEQDRARALAFADGPPAFELLGGRIQARLPVAEGERGADDTKKKAAYSRAGVKLEFVDGIQILSFGDPAKPTTEISLTVSEREYQPTAVAFVRARFGIAEDFDPAADAAVFFARAEGDTH
jgi:hypothetical protein